MRLSSSRSTAILHRPQQDFLLWDRAGTRPSLDQQFADRKDLVDAISGQQLITFTRASAGTYVGSDGLVKTATTDEARFDHDPVTGESLGLLVEEQRTNLITNSANVAAYFIEQNSTPTADAAVSPDGTTTATLLTPDTTLATHTSFNTSISFLADTTYSYSVFVKPNGYNYLQLLFTSGFGNLPAWVNFNLSGAGFIGFSGGGELSKQIQAYPGGWYRCTITATSGSSTFASGPAYLVLDSDRNSRDANYAGNNTDGAYIWGAQLEIGANGASAPFPTSYIPTAGSTVTRSADVVSISGSNFSSWYKASGGTVFSQFDSVIPNPGNTFFPWLLWNSGSDYLGSRTATGYEPDRLFFVSRVSESNSFSSESNPNGYLNMPIGMTKGAFAFELNNFGVAWNGGTFFSSASGDIPAGITKLDVGSENGANIINGHIKRLTYWPQRLPNETLQTITQ